MDVENKHTQNLTVFPTQWKKKHTVIGAVTVELSAVEAACFTLFHRQEEKNPREETLVKPRQNVK